MAKKPDKWERIANSFFKNEGPFYACEVAQLLRKEHAWVMRMVLREFKVWATTSPNGYASMPASRHERAKQCRDILDKLRRRAI